MNYVEIPLPRLALALLFLAAAALVSFRLRLGLVRAIVVAGARAVAQLLAVGYVLAYIFGADHPGPAFGALAVMLLAAAFTSANRVQHGPPRRELVVPAFITILAGSLLALVPALVWIFPSKRLFEPRYAIPVSGMIVSQAMNVVALTFERIFAAAHTGADEIEQKLSLGATPLQAMGETTRIAVKAALIPTLNGLSTVGLVALPGMMTGQILSGTDPMQAVRYQLVILVALVAVAAVSGALAAHFARLSLFTAREQLRRIRVPNPGGSNGSPR